jgi:DNA-binding FrmR family transcriptional regulator
LKTKGYPDIVQQVSAVRAALDGVTQVIIEDLVEYYISQITDSNGKNAAIELNDTVSRVLRLSVLT